MQTLYMLLELHINSILIQILTEAGKNAPKSRVSRCFRLYTRHTFKDTFRDVALRAPGETVLSPIAFEGRSR